MRRLSASAWLVLLPMLLCAAPAWADGPLFTDTCNTLSWTANTEVDLAGYNLYDRTSLSNPYTKIGTVGLQITSVPCSQFNFNMGQHDVSITAFDTSGNESAHATDVPFYLAHNLVTDLHVTAVTSTGVTLTWTEVDGGNGLPASYDVRLATPTISWGSAASVTSGTCATPVAGTSIGASKSCTVTGLSTTTPYQFELVPYSGTLGQPGVIFGPLSNITGATTGGSVPGATRTLMASDAFPGANGALPSPWQGGYAAGFMGTPQITSHTVYGSVVGVEYYAAYVTPTPATQYAVIKVDTLLTTGTAASQLGVMLRATAPPTVSFVLLFLQKQVGGSGITAQLATYTSGVWSTIASDSSATWSATDLLIAEANGTTYNLYRSASGVETLLLSSPITDATFASGYTGLFSWIGPGGTITDAKIGLFEMGTLVSGTVDICGCDNH